MIRKALGEFPEDPDLLVELSRAQVSLNLTDDAIGSASEALKLQPQSLSANLAFAEALASAHQYERMLGLLHRVQPQFETRAELHYLLGIANFGIGNRTAAIQAFSQAVELDPRFDLSHFLLGTTYLVTGDFPRAEQHYKTAIALNSKNSLYYSYLMRVYRATGFQEGALETARKALALNPADVDSRLELTKWEISQEHLAQARTLLEDLVADAPDWIPARVLLAGSISSSICPSWQTSKPQSSAPCNRDSGADERCPSGKPEEPLDIGPALGYISIIV
ncbi:MAG: tetratricopeptide repeat protein [Bryobacteraceae bacterium]